MSPLETAVDVAATARLTRLVTEDEIMEPVRDYVQGHWPRSKAAYLVTCPLCVSVWAGALVAGLGQSPWSRWVKRTLALSEATILVRQLTDG